MRVGRLLGNVGLDSAVVMGVTGLSDLSGVEVLPAPAWMRRMWVGDVGAMTVMSRIFMRPDLIARPDARLLVHELVHVRQWRTEGFVRFLLTYALDYVRARLRGAAHGEAYGSIRYEVEAVSIAGG